MREKSFSGEKGELKKSDFDINGREMQRFADGPTKNPKGFLEGFVEAEHRAIEELDPEEKKECEEKLVSYKELLVSLNKLGVEIDTVSTSTGGEFVDMGDFFYLYLPLPESVRKISYPTMNDPSLRIRVPK